MTVLRRDDWLYGYTFIFCLIHINSPPRFKLSCDAIGTTMSSYELALPWLRDAPSLQPDHLARLLDSKAYAQRLPFPHVVIDHGLFPRELLHQVLAELPESTTRDGCANSSFIVEASKGLASAVVPTHGGSVGKSTFGKFRCFMKAGTQVRKSQITSEKLMGKATLALFGILRSPRFVNWLEALSGLRDLIPDPNYYGSGVHLVGQGGCERDSPAQRKSCDSLTAF